MTRSSDKFTPKTMKSSGVSLKEAPPSTTLKIAQNIGGTL